MKKRSYITGTDQFCGAGGSTTGAKQAGVEVRLALNHDRLAIETHNTNHPEVDHDRTDISACDPRKYPSTDILITSPECTEHTLANGKKKKYQEQLQLFGKVEIDPAEERSRATMWDVVRFAEYHRYNIIVVENVVEARTKWAPFEAWLHAMRLLGYEHEVVYFNSMFAYPTPQSRDRIYVVFWRKGNRRPNLNFHPPAWCQPCGRNVDSVQSWKQARKPYGKYRQQYVYRCPTCTGEVQPYYYAAANAIDWTLPAPRIGDRKKPLEEKTLRRISAGLEKFGRQPQLVSTNYFRDNYAVAQPYPTQTSGNQYALLAPPFIVDMAWYEPNRRCPSVEEPMSTQTGRQTMGLAIPPFLVDMTRTRGIGSSVEAPYPTQTGTPLFGLAVPPFLTSYYGQDKGHELTDPVPTVPTVDRHGLVVPPFLVSYYTRLGGREEAVSSIEETVPTVPGWAVHYLAQPGETPTVEECGFRMLQPHEIQKAMAFPDEYVVLGTQREKVKQLGNAVTPPVMQMLLERCIATLD